MSDAPETIKNLAYHLRKMADRAVDGIDGDRLARAADLLTPPPTQITTDTSPQIERFTYLLSRPYGNLTGSEKDDLLALIKAISAERDELAAALNFATRPPAGTESGT